MTSEEPTYLSQGVSYLGFLAQQLGDLRGKTTLAHELIQNADDAKDDHGNLAATNIAFDVTQDALLVSNDAVFREIDFDRMRELASGSKRREAGHRPTGAFGVGFVSVYQITDRPEIHSAGRRWVFRPEYTEDKRIKQTKDPSITHDQGTRFKLPWAYQDSKVRQELSSPIVDEEYVDSFAGELSEDLPRTILFLKKLETIDLLRNGKRVAQVARVIDGNTVLVDCNGETRTWRFLEGKFTRDASNLRARFSSLIDADRSSLVRVAVPDSLANAGLLFATLPTDQSTGLPFHIDADFFPASDRKSIVFEDTNDPRSEWNRAAIKAAASALGANLIPLRDYFKDDAATLWGILARLNAVHRERHSDRRMPLGLFWEALETSLVNAPVVYAQSGRWLKPNQILIPISDEEKRVAAAFNAIGLETVHESLWSYQNVLTSNSVGVRRIDAKNVFGALKEKGMVGNPLSFPPGLESREVLELLWRGVLEVLERTPSAAKASAADLLARCSLAPGMDGRLWPCRAAFRADDRTRRLFESLLPEDLCFLAEEQVPLFERLCPKFAPEEAIMALESLGTEDLNASWKRGDFAPSDLLKWFDDNKSELTGDSGHRLAELPLFPSATDLHSLNDLWLPGGFDDPMGVTDVLDTNSLEGLADFMRSLGIKELTFENYAMKYIAEAFASGDRTAIEVKLKHLTNLEVRIGEIRGNRDLRDKLSAANIIECEDGTFRRPSEVYFRSDAVKNILGDFANYANVPPESENRTDLYGWLGVGSRARVRDILRIIEMQSSKLPTPTSRLLMVKMIEALGSLWGDLDDSEKSAIAALREKEWLPAEGDSRKWYKPTDLYAVYNKNYFESQAKFVDLPVQMQQSISPLVAFLGIGRSPEPAQVINHLLRCVDLNHAPPAGIYQWLDENAAPRDIEKLMGSPCLWVLGRYRSPAQVFWGAHRFGRFRIQLGADLLARQKLLQALGVRQSPAFQDAIDVLKDLSEELGTGRLNQEEQAVVLQCWVILSEALQKGELAEEYLQSELRDIPSVPNNDWRLRRASWLFFEGRPGFAEKFPRILRDNCIPRMEQVWTAMEAAGVRNLSTAIQGHINEAVNPIEVYEIRDRIVERGDLIRTILEGGSHQDRSPDTGIVSLDYLRFYCVDELNVVWELQAFDRLWPPTPPEQVQAHLDVAGKAVFFTRGKNGGYPWSSIARELSFAVTSDEAIGSVSPGIRTILEAETVEEAIEQAQELGIASTEQLGDLSTRGAVADTFDDDQGYDNLNKLTDIDANDVLAGGPPDGPFLSDTSGKQDDPDIPFAKKLYDVQTVESSRGAQRQVWLPRGGPRTDDSAKSDTEESVRVGRSGSTVSREISRWEPFEAANILAERFRSMVHGDYGERCQICSRSFAMTNGSFQTYVVHVVRPSTDHRTNHLGDLLGLCGWHYALIRYGKWAFLDPSTKQPFQDSSESEGWEKMRAFMANAPEVIDDSGYSYIGVPIRFWNVFQDWDSTPRTIDEEVRYSLPHWKYLCELLQV